jgi:Na+/H+ antiporter NhaD/arsenite permease-like protein
MIGSAAHLSFNDFVVNLAPVILVVMAVQLVAMQLIWGRHLQASAAARERVMTLDTRALITDPALMWNSLLVIGAVVAAFVFAAPLHLEPGTIALFGAATLMLLHNFEHHREPEKQTVRVTETFNEVDWITIFFFLGLFVIVHGIDAAGALDLAARSLMSLTKGDPGTTAVAILWGSAILSAIVDNIPFVAAMIPLIRELGPQLAGAEQVMPLWWALSLGACLGGNGTLIGASANLSVAGIAERTGIDFSFATYTKHAFGLTLISVAICNVYLWLRYL